VSGNDDNIVTASEMGVYRHIVDFIQSHSHEQRIRSRVWTWCCDHSLISPPGGIFHLRTANEFVTSNGTSPTSNARAPLPPDHAAFRVMTVLGDWISTRETTTDPTEGGTNRARSAAAARWGELAGGVVVPPRSGLLFHLSGEVSQDVRWQLSIGVGLGNIVTKLGWVVAIVHHSWVLIRDRGLVAGNHRAASGNVRWGGVLVVASMEDLGHGWMRLQTTRNLLGMSVGDTVLVNRKRGDIVGKLVAARG